MKLIILLLALGTSQASSAGTPFRVGLVIDQSGRNDRGFNAAAVRGLERARETFHLAAQVAEANPAAGHEALLEKFAEENYNLVIALGEQRAPILKRIAAKYPKVHFAIVDAEVRAPNIRSILFKEQEGSYLVGAIAAMMTKSKKLGFVGGMDLPVIHRYEAGFNAGAKKINPRVGVTAQYIGNWSDRARAKALALAQYGSGIDIIYAVSGASNLGVFDAADEKKAYAIGVSDQNWIKPGRILTSMQKRVDVGIFMVCQDAFLGQFTPEVKRYGLAAQGVEFAVDQDNEKVLPKSVIERAEALSQEIIAGKIQVPDHR